MTARPPRPSRDTLDVLRALVASAVEETTLRVVARQVGMSAAAVEKFLGGAHPTPPTYRKLRSWYDRHPAPESPPPADDGGEPSHP